MVLSSDTENGEGHFKDTGVIRGQMANHGCMDMILIIGYSSKCIIL